MALRLRRGTDSERQLITPLEGELIYTTDTKILYMGDGVTQGGLQVTGVFPESIDDLTDVDISSISPTVGQVLTWNGEQFLPADTIGSGEQINADIIADDSTILVDSETQNFQGNAFAGNTFTGAFIGDGSQLTNLPIATDGSGVIEGSNYRINITSDDSTIMVDTDSQIFTGTLQGNVISDDSTTVMVDVNNDRLSTTDINIENYSIYITSEDHGLTVFSKDSNLVGNLNDGSIETSANYTALGRKGNINGEIISPIEDDVIGSFIVLCEFDTDVSEAKSVFTTRIDTITGLSQRPTRKELWLENEDGNLEVKLSVNSRGVTESQGPFKMPSYANDIDRDTKIPSPEQGMVIFNQRDDSTGVPQFQGYNGIQWVDLH